MWGKSTQKLNNFSNPIQSKTNLTNISNVCDEYYSTQNTVPKYPLNNSKYPLNNSKYILNNKQNKVPVSHKHFPSASRYNKQKSLIKSNSVTSINMNVFPRTTLKQLTKEYELSLSNISYQSNKLKKCIFGKHEIKLEQKQKIKVRSTPNYEYKLCINCLSYVNNQMIDEHQNKCLGFNIILKMSKLELVQFIDQKIQKKLIQISNIKSNMLSLQQKQISQKIKFQSLINKNDQIIQDLSTIRIRALKRLYAKN